MVIYLSVIAMAGLITDRNGDGSISIDDADLMCRQVESSWLPEHQQPSFVEASDFSGDGRFGPWNMDHSDFDGWLDAVGHPNGDSNWDGVFDSEDFVYAFSNMSSYGEFHSYGRFSTGDWDCSELLNGRDTAKVEQQGYSPPSLERRHFVGTVTRVTQYDGSPPVSLEVGDSVSGYFQWFTDPSEYDLLGPYGWTRYGDHETVALTVDGDDYFRSEKMGAIFGYGFGDQTRLTSGQDQHGRVEWDGTQAVAGTGRIGTLHVDTAVWFAWQAVAVPEPTSLWWPLCLLLVTSYGLRPVQHVQRGWMKETE